MHSEGSQSHAAAFIGALGVVAEGQARRARSSCKNPSTPPRAFPFAARMNFIHAVTALLRRIDNALELAKTQPAVYLHLESSGN